MRIRTIKPEFWRNEALSKLDPQIQLLAIGLLNMADDEGYFMAHPSLIRADLFPFRDEYGSCTVHLRELSKLEYIRLGTTPDGKPIGRVLKFSTHQVINKPKASKIKPLWKEYGTDTVLLPDASRLEQGTGKGKETEVERPPQGAQLTDSSFIEELKKLYTWVDFDKEQAKMKAWFLTPKGKGRKMTRAFMVRWLNKIDKPMDRQSSTGLQGKDWH